MNTLMEFMRKSSSCFDLTAIFSRKSGKIEFQTLSEGKNSFEENAFTVSIKRILEDSDSHNLHEDIHGTGRMEFEKIFRWLKDDSISDFSKHFQFTVTIDDFSDKKRKCMVFAEAFCFELENDMLGVFIQKLDLPFHSMRKYALVQNDSIMANCPNILDSEETSSIDLNNIDEFLHFSLKRLREVGRSMSRIVENNDRSYLIDLKPLTNNDTLAAITDITDAFTSLISRLQEEKLEALCNFSDSFSQEFNNLLTVITGYTGMAIDELENLDDKSTAESIAGMLEMVSVASQKGINHIRRLMNSAGYNVSSMEEVDLNSYLSAKKRILERLAGSEISLEVNFNTESANVYVDPAALDMIIFNLVANSREALLDIQKDSSTQYKNSDSNDSESKNTESEKPSVKVELSLINPRKEKRYIDSSLLDHSIENEACSYYAISVIDNGPGFPSEIANTAFDPFITSRSGTQHWGTGLTAVHRAVKSNGGLVKIASNTASGVTIDVLFPEKIKNNTEITNKTDVLKSGKDELSVLIVEDSDYILKFANTVLSRKGFKAFCAVNAEEGMNIFLREQKNFDLLLTDIYMPGEDGISLSYRMQKLNSNLKVVYMSGNAGAVLARDGISTENMIVLNKPFSPAELMAKINEALKNNIDDNENNLN